MPAFKICQPDQYIPQSLPPLKGMKTVGELGSKAMIASSERPLRAWIHDLPRETRISWDAPPVGHAVFVLEGEVAAAGTVLGPSGAAFVEHGGTMELQSRNDATKVIHFFKDEAAGKPTRLAGGHVHVQEKDGIYQFKTQDPTNPRHGVLYAESECPTCEMWLHTSLDWPASSLIAPHYHTSDEIIVVLGGSMIFGRAEIPVGGALAIDALTTYGFKAGPNGLSFVNFRSDKPGYVEVKRVGLCSMDMKPPMVENESQRVRKLPTFNVSTGKVYVR